MSVLWGTVHLHDRRLLVQPQLLRQLRRARLNLASPAAAATKCWFSCATLLECGCISRRQPIDIAQLVGAQL